MSSTMRCSTTHCNSLQLPFFFPRLAAARVGGWIPSWDAALYAWCFGSFSQPLPVVSVHGQIDFVLDAFMRGDILVHVWRDLVALTLIGRITRSYVTWPFFLIYIYMYMYIYKSTHVYIYIYIYKYIHIDLHIYLRIFYIYIYIYISTYMFSYIWIYIYMHIRSVHMRHIHIFTYIQMYIYAYSFCIQKCLPMAI